MERERVLSICADFKFAALDSGGVRSVKIPENEGGKGVRKCDTVRASYFT